MKKIVLLCLLVFGFPHIGLAEIDYQDDLRQYLIEKEFNCIKGYSGQDRGFDWEETCYKEKRMSFSAATSLPQEATAVTGSPNLNNESKKVVKKKIQPLKAHSETVRSRKRFFFLI